MAHAHTGKYKLNKEAIICVRRGLGKQWRDTIKHEVAHFAAPGDSHGLSFQKARAQQGDRGAKAALRKAGAMRCAKHEWVVYKNISHTQEVTSKGLRSVYLSQAQCRHCRKVVP